MTHPDEAARIAELQRFEILDSPQEAAFDDIVNLAARLCGKPISVINLIDTERQWFKAETGLGIRETPLDTSICAHAILEDDFVEIADTLSDPRMSDNPLCTSVPGLRFYAGAILRGLNGQPIGTLCVLDHAPGELSELQRETLRVLAAQVMTQLELRATLRTEALLRQEIDHRVKNSLQLVAAFAQLQRRRLDPAAGSALLALEQQIGALALLHDTLSHSDDSTHVDLADYLGKVTRMLAGTVLGTVHIDGQFESMVVTSKVANALGSVINELITNALKHSFDITGEGAISLTGAYAGRKYRIICVDDGAAPSTKASGSGLGKRIMAGALRQVGGTLTGGSLTGGGYCSTVEFATGLRGEASGPCSFEKT